MLLLLPGCLGGNDDDRATSPADCLGEPARESVFWFGPGHTLQANAPAGGEEAGNGFTEAFLTNDLKEWLSEPVPAGLHLEGNVTVVFWARNVGTPAPIVIGGEPGEAYHFFNQFGSDRSFQPAYAVEYAEVVPEAGSVAQYTEVLQLPAGGFVLERGDRVRLLLTSLVLDDAEGSGHDILFGGETPSHVRFSARCYPDRSFPSSSCQTFAIELRGNQGLLTGAIPPQEGVNTVGVPLEVNGTLSRLDVALVQTGGPRLPKQDIDVDIQDSAGTSVWSIGSPYTNERGLLFEENIEEALAPGTYTIRVNSYSGTQYNGALEVCGSWGDPLLAA
jgi:hypothetical protein